MRRFSALLLFSLLVAKVQLNAATENFGAQQNIEGDLYPPPRSDVVMQSVVLNRHRPHGPTLFEEEEDDIGLRSLLRRLLGGRRRVIRRLIPYKKTPLDGQDSESIDAEELERLVKRVSRREEGGDEAERLVEQPRRNRRRRGEEAYWRKAGGEEEAEEWVRRLKQRRERKRKEWEKGPRRMDGQEWEPHTRDSWKRNHDDKVFSYLPAQFSRPKHYPTEEYIK